MMNWVRLFENKGMDTFVTNSKSKKTAKFKCNNFLEQDKAKALMILGDAGAGKTHLALAMAKEYFLQGEKVEVVNYREIVRLSVYKERIMREYNKAIDSYIDADVLLIDDLFCGAIVDVELSNDIYEIINRRYEDQKITIITSWRNITELLDMNEPIISRLIEMTRREYICYL